MNIFKEVSKWFQDFKAGFVYNNDVPPVLDTKSDGYMGTVGGCNSSFGGSIDGHMTYQQLKSLNRQQQINQAISGIFDDSIYGSHKLAVYGYAKKYKLKPQCQIVLLNLLYKGETRIEDYIDDNSRFDLNRRICDLREKGFQIETVQLFIKGQRGIPCKFVYKGSPDGV